MEPMNHIFFDMSVLDFIDLETKGRRDKEILSGNVASDLENTKCQSKTVTNLSVLAP